MRILCLTPWFPAHRQDQRGNFILDSVEALADIGHEIIVLVSQPWRPNVAGIINKEWIRNSTQASDFSKKIKIYTQYYYSIPRCYLSSFSNWSYRHNTNPIMEKIIQRHGCQLIHAHTELAAISAVDVGRKLNIPSVVTLHGISTEPKLYKGRNKKLLYEYGISYADRVIMVGEPLVDFFKNIVKKVEHFRVVHNGFRVNPYNENNTKTWNKDTIRFISVSNLVEGKGIDVNLHALAKINKSGLTNWKYYIIGDGSQKKELMKIARTLNLNHQVEFIGACDHNLVYTHLNQSDVFILPSYREAFGIAYLEAMSCGLLTIGVAGEGPQAFIEHARTGFLVEPNNIDSLVDVLKYTYAHPEKVREIASAGRAHVYNKFTWKNHAINITKVFSELVNQEYT